MVLTKFQKGKIMKKYKVDYVEEVFNPEESKSIQLEGDKRYRVVWINIFEDIKPFEVTEYIFAKNEEDVFTKIKNCIPEQYRLDLQIVEVCEWDMETPEV